MMYIGFFILSLITLAGVGIAGSGISSLQTDYLVLTIYASDRLSGQDPAAFLADLMREHQAYLRQAWLGFGMVLLSVPLWGAWRKRYITGERS